MKNTSRQENFADQANSDKHGDLERPCRYYADPVRSTMRQMAHEAPRAG
jgi:hypothetical protein